MSCRIEFPAATPSSTHSPPPPPPPSPSPSLVASQTRFSPAQRSAAGNSCFNCQMQGHWFRDCPFRSPNKSQSSMNGSGLPVFECPCGEGVCKIFTSMTPRNPNRKFYSCPGSGCGFFKWCDKVSAPDCLCGDGKCTVNKERDGPNAGRFYFTCRITKGHGACTFFQWADVQSDGTISEHVDASVHCSPPQPTISAHQVSNMVHTDLDNEEVQAIDDQLRVVAIENESHVPNSSTSDILMKEVEPQDPILENEIQVSHQVFQFDIRRRQEYFWRQISAAADTSNRDICHQILGLHVLGWWGRLAYPPSRSLMDPSLRPFFSSIFPSLESTIIPQNMDISTLLPFSSSHERDLAAPQTYEQDAHLSNGILSASLAMRASLDTAMTVSINKAFGQAALEVQNDLLAVLMSTDPLQHDTMQKAAEQTFVALERLSVDCGPFSEWVKEFIRCASRVAGIEWSIRSDQSSQEAIKQYNDEKTRFDCISCMHDEAVATFMDSEQRLKSLREEASRVKAMLLHIERELSHCETRTSQLEARVLGISKDMVESKKSMEAASLQMERSLELRNQRESELRAAKAALENAKVQLQH